MISSSSLFNSSLSSDNGTVSILVDFKFKLFISNNKS